MPDASDPATRRDEDPFAIDTRVAHPARLQNYLAGGESNFSADREAAEKMSAALPGGLKTARGVVRILGSFVGRAVRYLAADAGLRQFIDIGVAPPGERKVHDVAQQAAPDTRFVYVSDDPVVLAEAHALRRSSPEGATAYVHGTLHELDRVFEEAGKTLDLARPVAVLLITTLNFIPEDSDPHGIVARLVDALAPGSHLVVAHASFDIPAEGMPEAAATLNQTLNVPWVVRARDEILRFFDGLDMLDPGLVPIEQWRPDPAGKHHFTQRPVPIYGGVGLKP